MEVRFDAEPIQGRLYDHDNGGRLDRTFSGWLGLMAAIEAASSPEPPSQQESKGGPG